MSDRPPPAAPEVEVDPRRFTALWWAVAGPAVVFALLFGPPANWTRRQD
ncbi:hypothetical protein [Actinomadura rayongensis]|uniref:Uncharacterized protein n=1 Tax=Actinomadura rayongensis TaxID=1429076 RepID=A0A6I4WF60_9ACTN|nr:hypothetical protein [Actinomadura rayongensis]MXQ65564.1 hypothetical protein [Actinomadura rayongensis]